MTRLLWLTVPSFVIVAVTLVTWIGSLIVSPGWDPVGLTYYVLAVVAWGTLIAVNVQWFTTLSATILLVLTLRRGPVRSRVAALALYGVCCGGVWLVWWFLMKDHVL